MSVNRTVFKGVLKILSVLWWLGLLGFILAILVSLVGLNIVDGYTRSATLNLAVDDPEYALTTINPDASAELKNLEATLSVRSRPTTLDKLKFVGFFVANFSIFLFIVHRLRAVVRSLLMSDGVSARNVFDIRLVAWVILTAKLLSLVSLIPLKSNVTPIQDEVQLSGVLSIIGISYSSVDYRLDVWLGGFFSGLVLLTVAEIMAYAYQVGLERDTLREEQALTV